MRIVMEKLLCEEGNVASHFADERSIMNASMWVRGRKVFAKNAFWNHGILSSSPVVAHIAVIWKIRDSA
jgi:hypothetical protein